MLVWDIDFSKSIKLSRNLPDPAQDIFQDKVLQWLIEDKEFESQLHFDKYVYLTLRRTLMKIRRKKIHKFYDSQEERWLKYLKPIGS